MAENESDVPDFRADVPTTGAIVKTSRDAQSLAIKMRGDRLPDEMRFSCITCGWDKTLKFEEEEMEALGGDVSSYSGPCGGCGSMTLVPRAHLMGGEFKSINEQVKESRREEFQEQAEVFVDTVKKQVLGGSIFDQGGAVHGSEEAAASVREDLPSADDIDDDLKSTK